MEGAVAPENGGVVGRFIQKTAWAVSLALVGLGCHTVEPGHVGVAVNWGKVEPWCYSEGYHGISPFTDVYDISVRTQQTEWSGPEAIGVLSSDQLTILLDVTVQYHLNPGQAAAVYRTFGAEYSNTVVIPAARAAIRDAVNAYTAIDAVSSRDELPRKMVALARARVGALLQSRRLPIWAVSVDDLVIRDIALPQSLQASIASVQQQRQRGEERRQAIATARQEADRARIEAEGAARVAQINAERDALVLGISARATALANREVSASLTREVLELRRIEATRSVLSSAATRTVITDGSHVLFGLQ